MEKEHNSHRKRFKRFDIPGHAHYLTFSCFKRQPFLSGDKAPIWLAESITAARISKPFDLWAYVFMPEHVHLLLRPHEGIKLGEILKQIKQPVAVKAVKYVKDYSPAFLSKMKDIQPNGKYSHRFWQRGGGYDRNLWTQKDISIKINYIHANPVRRGLVKSPADWKWSSFKAWEEGIDEPLHIDRESLVNTFP